MKFKITLNLLTSLVITLSFLLLLTACGEGSQVASNLQQIVAAEAPPSDADSTPAPSQETQPTSTPGGKATPGPTGSFAVTPTPINKPQPQTQSYLEGTYNCFAQGIASASGYANSYLFRPDGTWADITYGKQYASNPKYNFTYQLQNANLTLNYPSGNTYYKLQIENGKNKLVQYGDKYNQTCYQKI